ncbi:hypothetical protein H8356DRAFT_1429831 [Neocallimastix lanati (nom. inval.)]|nr:hypothetical protein H8356DRAFT_1429831 [Neocallimastix sp. JGI-2020a]
MIKIFSNMKEAKAPKEEKKSNKSNFILNSDITVDSLYNKIKEDLKLWSYFSNWGNTTKEETHDDPMDIDNAGKFKGKGKQNKVNKIQKYDSNNQEHERNTRKGKEEKDKYCYICDMNNPDVSRVTEWATEPFGRVHMYIVLLKQSSLYGNNCFLTILDDYSRYEWFASKNNNHNLYVLWISINHIILEVTFLFGLTNFTFILCGVMKASSSSKIPAIIAVSLETLNLLEGKNGFYDKCLLCINN